MQEAASASLIQDTMLHSVNVLIHVLLGTAALALGVRQLAATKGDESHRRFGRWFLACIWGAVGTAAVGILVFEFRAFLGVITLLVAYWAFAGYRTLRLRNHGPTLTDALGSVAGLGAAGLFVWPRWTGQNRPFRRRAKPAIADRGPRRVSSTSSAPRCASRRGLWCASSGART